MYSSIGQVPKGQPLIAARPVRSPHHTASTVAVVGGERSCCPARSAQRTTAYLSSTMPEFHAASWKRRASRWKTAVLPSQTRPQLDPLPCPLHACRRANPTPKGSATPNDETSQRQMERYLSRISGPLIDRVDIHVEVPPVPCSATDRQT
ncbi:MAG: ATP-binding protein [Phycisphaerales bacterium]